MAVLLGALVTFGRLSTDSEITALKASGFSFYRMVAPVLAVSFVAMAVTAYFSLYLGPKKAGTFKKDLFIMAKSRAFINIEEEVFNDTFKKVIIYAQKTPSPNEMEGVFISDERDPDEARVIIAQQGMMDVDVATGYAYLRPPTQHTQEGNKAGSYQRWTSHQHFSINSTTVFQRRRKKGKREMSLEPRAAGWPVPGRGYPLRPSTQPFYHTAGLYYLARPVPGSIRGAPAGHPVSLWLVVLRYITHNEGRGKPGLAAPDLVIAALMPNTHRASASTCFMSDRETSGRNCANFPGFKRKDRN
jgi:hypothetical protein